MKIRDRVYAISFFSCVLPMLFLSFFISNLISSRVIKEEKHKIEMTIGNVNSYLGGLVNEVHNSLDKLTHIASTHEDKEELITYMKDYGNRRTEIEGYYLGDVDGRFFSGWARTEEEFQSQLLNDYTREDYDPRTRPWYNLGINNNDYVISDLYKDSFDDKIVMTISKKVSTREKVIGVIGADFNLFPVKKNLYKLNPWKKGGFLIIANDGELVIDASTINNFYERNIDTIKNNLLGDSRDAKDNDITFNITSLNYFGFKLVSIFSEKELYSTLIDIKRSIYLIVFLSLIFSTIIVGYFGRNLSNSMDRLSYLINSIAKGNYTKNIDKLSVIIDDKSELYLVKEAVKNMQSQIKERERQLKDMAEIDGLTQTLNRKTIINIMEIELQKTISFSAEFSIIMFDYDNFKLLNDTYGHQFGDKVLIDISRHVKDTLKVGDFIGRYGGEEFLIVLPGTGKQGAVRVAERIRKNIEEMEWITGAKVTVSGGVVEVESERNIEVLIKKVDDLLYLAKDNGRNRFKH